eukprot:2923853-Prymnesium_polylepis.1
MVRLACAACGERFRCAVCCARTKLDKDTRESLHLDGVSQGRAINTINTLNAIDAIDAIDEQSTHLDDGVSERRADAVELMELKRDDG